MHHFLTVIQDFLPGRSDYTPDVNGYELNDCSSTSIKGKQQNSYFSKNAAVGYSKAMTIKLEQGKRMQLWSDCSDYTDSHTVRQTFTHRICTLSNWFISFTLSEFIKLFSIHALTIQVELNFVNLSETPDYNHSTYKAEIFS